MLDPDSPLYRMRHSSAHVMATAVCRLFDDVQLDIGPPTEDGFYYDFGLSHRLTPEDFERIEDEMRKIIAEDQPFERIEVSREEALKMIQDMGQTFKLERLADIPEGEAITFYRNGEFLDLCRGPHVPSTGKIGHFKLMSVAGAYWHGDESKQQLTRVYGTTWATKEELDAHLHRIEEAKKRLKDPKENQYVVLKIAYDVGFNSKSTFNTAFKKFTGMSPSEFREKHQDREEQTGPKS